MKLKLYQFFYVLSNSGNVNLWNFVGLCLLNEVYELNANIDPFEV